MKLRAAELERFIAGQPDNSCGMLIFGPDPIAVGQHRDRVAAALVGAEGETEMRLGRLDAATLRSDPAALQDALKAQSFFPGARAVLLEGATDGLTALLAEALAGALPGQDAFLIASAGVLPARSKLRKLFEGDKRCAALQLFDDPPGAREIEAMLGKAGLRGAAHDAVQGLVAVAAEIDSGSLARLIDQIALYCHGSAAPLKLEDLRACAPQNFDAGLDAALVAAAEGDMDVLARQLSRLRAQGVAPTSICIAAERYFRQLHSAAVDPEGPEAGLNRARPPVFGPRRAAMLSQIRQWGVIRLERVLRLLIHTDLALRSGSAAPAEALVSRALIGIARLRESGR